MIFKTMKGTLIFFITILLGLISLFIFFYFPSQFEKLEVNSLSDKASVLNKMSAYSVSPALNFNDPDNIKEVASGIIRNKDIMYLIIEDESGVIMFSYNKSLASDNNFKIINNKAEPNKYLIYKTMEKVVYRNNPVGNIYAGYSLVPIREAMVKNRIVIAIISIIIFIIATFLLNIIGRYALLPLTGITNTARNISHEDLSIRARESFGEIGELAAAFNLMLDKLQKSRAELEDWNKNLEDIVWQRTQDLQKEIDEKILTEQELIVAKNKAEEMNRIKSIFMAMIDNRHFITILENLINNAIKFTKTGTITVETGLKNSGNTDWAYCQVSDTGIGISHEKIKTIFEEFRQASEGFDRHYEGTGLGLTISKKLTEMMNGTISVQSELGTGSVFTVKFPAYTA